MSINTILLKLDNESEAPYLVDAARDVASQLDAHVTGICLTGNGCHPAVTVGRSASVGFENILDEAAEEKRAALQRIFTAIMSESELSWSWMRLVGQGVLPLIEESLYADLFIDGLSVVHDLESRLAGSEDDDLLLKCACPVLLVPRKTVGGQTVGGQTLGGVGRNIVIAWKPGREAARSVHGAIPLLRRAERVTIVSIVTQPVDQAFLHPLLKYLERCGVKPETRIEVGRKGEEPQRIFEHVQAVGANLLVMGAYSHSRLREMLLGGVTRDILAHMSLPCFMAR